MTSAPKSITPREFLRVLPLLLAGDWLFSYSVGPNSNIWFALMGATALFLAGCLFGIYLANLPVSPEQD